MICIDSSFIIDLLRNNLDASKVFDNIKSESLVTTTINVYELFSGIYKIKDRKCEQHIKVLEEFFDGIKILELDKDAVMEASKICGRLTKEGKIIDDLDILIAGICLVNGCTKIITRDKEHFNRIKELDVMPY